MRPFFVTRMGSYSGPWPAAVTAAGRILRVETVAVVFLIVLLAVVMPAPASAQAGEPTRSSTEGPAASDGVPGAGEVVRLARGTWDTGWFQAEIAAQLLTELGYAVDGPVTRDNEAFYAGLADGTVDLWLNGWLPLHQPLIDRLAAEEAVPVGFEVRGGALQGYLVDRGSAERLGIEDLGDLAEPDIAAVFDRDDDGLADLIGCEDGWSCGPIVDHHLEAYGLADTVEQVQGDYGPLMEATVADVAAGEPALFYTFTPNWTTGLLVPGDDVVWLPVPFPSLPADAAAQESLVDVGGVVGCRRDPCLLGFAPNDIRAVARRSFLADHPAIEALLTELTIPLDDISAQNATMIGGDDSAAAIAEAAASWIETNRAEIDRLVAMAVEAHLADGRSLNPRPSVGGPDRGSVGRLLVATRLAPPFVTHDGRAYSGFTLDLLDLIADDIGADVEVYAVNSTAKLIDDVERGEAAVGAGAVTITAEREAVVDFSQPFFDSGLQILVADRDEGFLGGRVGAVLRVLFSVDLLLLLLVLIGVLLVAAHVIWLTERRTNPDFPQSYRSGIWESLWWAAVTATTVGYGDKTPRGVTGRIFGLVWMFSGLFVLAYFTAGIATAFTIDELSAAIDEPADLRDHTVGVPIDTASFDYLERQGIAATTYPTAEDAYEALFAGEIEAVVHDAAILQHFVATDGRGGVHLSGLIFAERDFGFVLPADDDLIEPINRALLRLIENGDYAELHNRWFGSQPGGG